MADKFPIELEFIDGDALNYLKSVRDYASEAGQALEKGSQASTEALEQTAKAAKETSTSEKDLKDSVDKANKSIESQDKAAKKWQASLKESAREVNILGVNVGQTIDKLNAKKAALQGVTAGMTGASKAAKILRVALASTGIGLLIVALGSLVTYFTKTQKGIDAMRVAMVQARSVIDNLVDRISKFGGGLTEIIKGNFTKGLKEIKDTFSGIGDEIRKDITASGDLEKRSQALRDKQRALNLEYEQTRGKIAELRFEARQNADNQEKAIDLLKQAATLEDDLAAKRTELAQENLAIIKERNSLAESFVADLDAEAQAEGELARITQENQRRKRQYYTEQLTFENQLKAANEQKRKDLEAEAQLVNDLVDRYNDLYTSIQEEINDLEYDQLSPLEQLEKDQAKALEALEAIIKETQKAYKDAYDAEIDLTEEHERSKALITQKYANERLKIIEEEKEKRANDNTNIPIEVLPTISSSEEAFNKAAAGVKAAMSKYAKSIREGMEEENVFDEIKDKLKDALNIDDAELELLTQSIRSVFSTFGAAFTDNIDNQLDKNTELLDQLKERREQAKTLLDEEIEDQAAGYANDVDNRKTYYDELLSQEESLEKEREQLLKKQQQAQAARDNAQQISSLVTAAANFFSSGAKFGPIAGVALASTAIASMYAIIKSARSRAQESSKLFTGGSLEGIEGGFIKKHGRNDKYGRGYRIEGTNTEVGGNEFLINQSTALRDTPFLEKYNAGKLDWINFNALANATRSQFKPVTEVMPNVSDYNREIAISRISSKGEMKEALKEVLPDLFNRNVMGITHAIKNRREFIEVKGEIYEYRDGKVKKLARIDGL